MKKAEGKLLHQKDTDPQVASIIEKATSFPIFIFVIVFYHNLLFSSSFYDQY
jgi:hypothetical protein